MKSYNKKNTTKSGFIKFCILLAVLVVMLILSLYLFPYFSQLSDETKRAQLVEFIRGQGILGVLILLGLQVLQVVVAVIPGEIIEIVAGIIYGTVGGYIICTVGVLLSSMLVYYTVKKLGSEYIQKTFASDHLKRFTFLNDSKKLEVVIFILFFLPGTPKDMLTYLVPFTKIKPMHFFVISSIARIPSIISSTFAGANLIEGDYITSIVVFVITGGLGVLGIFNQERILNVLSKIKK